MNGKIAAEVFVKTVKLQTLTEKNMARRKGKKSLTKTKRNYSISILYNIKRN